MRTFALLATFLFMAGAAWHSPSNGSLRGRRALRLAAAATTASASTSVVSVSAIKAPEAASAGEAQAEAHTIEAKEDTGSEFESQKTLHREAAEAPEKQIQRDEFDHERRAQAMTFGAFDAFEAATVAVATVGLGGVGVEPTYWNLQEQDRPMRRMAARAGAGVERRRQTPQKTRRRRQMI